MNLELGFTRKAVNVLDHVSNSVVEKERVDAAESCELRREPMGDTLFDWSCMSVVGDDGI